jgi:hypothetical protein
MTSDRRVTVVSTHTPRIRAPGEEIDLDKAPHSWMASSSVGR